MNNNEQQSIEAVGDALKAKQLSVSKDGFRDWIWIVQGPSAISVDAYVPLPISDDAATDRIAAHINRIVQTDLLIPLLLSCHWHIVLSGSGWTAEKVADIQAKTQPHFRDDQIAVITLDDLKQ
jgi:hypothetical protein